MAGILREFRIVGVHRVIPTADELGAAVEHLWGENLVGAELTRAEQHVDQHFAGLYLIEVQVEPADAEVAWDEITQPVADVDPSSWQVPYDERVVDSGSGRWAFFLHFVQLDRPLMTPAGPRELPAATPMPAHLAGIEYEVP